jgi:hypothetical protein
LYFVVKKVKGKVFQILLVQKKNIHICDILSQRPLFFYNEDVIVPARLREALIADLESRGINGGIRLATVWGILKNMGYKQIRKEMKIKKRTGSVWSKEGYGDNEIRRLFENGDFDD